MVSTGAGVANMSCRSPIELLKGPPPRGNEATSEIDKGGNVFQSNESRKGAWYSKSKSPVKAVSGKAEEEGKGAAVPIGSDVEKDSDWSQLVDWWLAFDSESSR